MGDITSNLIVHIPMDEVPSLIADQVGGMDSITVTNGLGTVGDGVIDGALKLDPTLQTYVQMSDGDDNFAYADMTVAFWMYLPDSLAGGFNVLLHSYNSSTHDLSLTISHITGQATLKVYDQSKTPYSQANGTDLLDDDWHHFAITRSDDSGAELWMDGTRIIHIDEPTITWYKAPAPFWHLSRYPYSAIIYQDVADSAFDDFRIYTRVLPVADIQDLIDLAIATSGSLTATLDDVTGLLYEIPPSATGTMSATLDDVTGLLYEVITGSLGAALDDVTGLLTGTVELPPPEYVAAESPFVTETYQVILTGADDSLPDAVLQGKQITARRRAGAQSYLQVALPYTDAVAAAISARPNGEIYVVRYANGSPQEIARVTLDYVDIARGTASKSVVISGHKYESTDLARVVPLYGLRSASNSNGVRRYRCTMNNDIMPGDIAEFPELDDEQFTVGLLTYTIGVKQSVMEVAEAE